MSAILRIAICTVSLIMIAGFAHANHVDCQRDIDNDGVADRNDTKIIDDAMGSRENVAPYDERADLDRNGRVDQNDRDAYAHCKPPPPPAKRAPGPALKRR
jgi:hypothetical protein